MLNGLWLSFFLLGAAAALARWLIGGDAAVFGAMVESLFAMAKLSVELMVVLFGTLTLWLGLLRIAEKAGLVDLLARMLGPLFARLMPEVPRGHPALGLISMNFAANGLGLDNAATPIGLKAMRALQDLNPSATTASPIAEFASSTSPIAAMRTSAFDSRDPSTSPVSPASPVRV